MQNAVQLIRNEEFDKIRVVIIGDEVWFVAVDVCRVLDLKNPTMAIKQLDDDERAKYYLGRQGNAWIVNESGLYSLIFMSRKPNAKKFRKWVTSEVLPSIRKFGYYSIKKSRLLDQMSDESKRVVKKINEEYPDDDIEFLGITIEPDENGSQCCHYHFGFSKDFARKLIDD